MGATKGATAAGVSGVEEDEEAEAEAGAGAGVAAAWRGVAEAEAAAAADDAMVGWLVLCVCSKRATASNIYVVCAVAPCRSLFL